jgi:hypothetical protein
MKAPIDKYRDPAGHRQRLRDRFLRTGREGLPDYELLELLLTYSIPRINTKPIAKALLHKFGTIVNVFEQPNERLEEIQGIGPNTITFFRVFQDCLTRCMEVQIESQRSISCPEDLFAFVRMHLGSRTTECIYALYLDPKDYFSGDYPDYEGGFRWREASLVDHWHEMAEAYFVGGQGGIKKDLCTNDGSQDAYQDLPDQLEVALELDKRDIL